MATKTHSLQVYEELAGWYDRQGQAKLRDWFLVLAADAALSLGHAAQAERLRQRLLHVNPHHMLRPYASFDEAMQAPDVQGYVADLRNTYPQERAEQLLQSANLKPAPPTTEERELKVFRGKEPPEIKMPPARQDFAGTSLEPKMPQPVPWTRPPTPPALKRPTPLVESPSHTQERATMLDYWVSVILFAVTLVVAGGLLVQVFVQF